MSGAAGGAADASRRSPRHRARCSLMETIWSPAWSPIRSAAVPSATWATEAVAGPAGAHEEPGEEDEREEDVREQALPRWRRLASRWQPASTHPARARRRCPRALDRPPSGQPGESAFSSIAAPRSRARLQPPAHPRRRRPGGAGQQSRRGAGISSQASPKATSTSDTGWAVHPGDLHEPSERDRAEAVLDAVALDAPDRRREADVEPSRAHPEQRARRRSARARG